MVCDSGVSPENGRASWRLALRSSALARARSSFSTGESLIRGGRGGRAGRGGRGRARRAPSFGPGPPRRRRGLILRESRLDLISNQLFGEFDEVIRETVDAFADGLASERMARLSHRSDGLVKMWILDSRALEGFPELQCGTTARRGFHPLTLRSYQSFKSEIESTPGLGQMQVRYTDVGHYVLPRYF